MSKRKSISKKLRFEVFKRDSFKCQYCGKSAPDVILHVDHIVPVKEGGTNDISNLITSCSDCNLGKGIKLLTDKSVIEKQRKQLEELNERREQLEMMMKWREKLLAIDDEKVNITKARFEELAKCSLNENGTSNLKKIIKKYPLDMILDSIDAAAEQYLEEDERGGFTRDSIEKAFDYISRICYCKQKSEDNPYMRDLLYIRGILRNRLYYCNEAKALKLLKDAYFNGASIENLKDLAKEVRNWTQFREGIESFLRGE